jgi:hypothetical protein
MTEFFNDSQGHTHALVQRWQDVIPMSLNEMEEWRGISDDDDHDRGVRLLVSSC